MAEEEIKKEQQLLVRATVNYLFLAQFETFRASLLRLNQKHPALAVAILQTVIEKGARIEGVAWSSRTSSPAHLTWLSIAELLNLETSTSAHPQALQLKAEFLLLIESIKSRIIPQTLTDQPQGPSNDRNGESAEVPAPEKATSSEGDGSLLFFESLSSCGLQRLQAEIFKSANSLPESLTESEAESVRRIARDHPELMAGLCDNIQRQVNFQSNSASKLAISLYDHGKALKEAEDDRLQSSGDRPPGVSSSVSENARDDFKLGLRIEEEAQLAHLDVLKESLERRDLESAIQRLRFLRQDNGLPSSMYWSIIRDLIKVLKTPDDDIGSQRFHLQMQEQMLKIYEEVLTSNSKQLTKMVEDIQDDLIHEEVEVNRVSNEYSFPPPLEKLDRLLKDLHTGHITLSIDLSTAEGLVTKSCKRELYHFARVSGEHVLEVVLKAALFAVKNEHLQEASNILALYPRLQPLVAAMGWDLLSGKTTARRKMLELLWTTKSTQLRLEDLSIYGRQGEEICCVEYLCDHLCFRLELAYFAACNNSGQNWDPKTCLLFSGKKGKRISEDTDGGPLDPFVANFVLERLAVQTPLRVLFDVVPDIKFKDALELVNMQPVPCATAAWHRLQDVELLHMHYGLQSAVLALGVMERSMSDDGIETNDQVALWFLKELQDHLEAIGSPPRKLWMMNIIISLLHMDDISINTNQSKLSYLHARISSASAREELAIPSPNKSEDQSVVAVIGFILKLLYRCLPSAGFELELKPSWSAVAGGAGKQAWEWRASTVKQFVEDWEWRLSVLKRLLPSPERQWNWKEALAILRAAPSTLLNLCMQRAQYDIGEEAVHRFALPPEDKVALQLAEWVDSAFTRASVEDAVSRVAEGTLSSEGGLDFATFRSHLGTLATVLLCIDVAVTSARSTNMAAQLLDQARSLLSEISTGCSQREGLIHWEQIQELCIISVAKRVLQRSQELLDQYKTGTLQATLSGETVVPASYDSNRQGNRHRALFSLQQIIEDAHRGKRQFLSGKLHNLVKAITDEESDESNTKVGSTYAERKAVLPHEQEIFLGLGFRPARQVPSSAPTSDQSGESLQFGIKSAGKRLIGHLSSRQSAYLAAFIRYIATIGDIVDGIDTTHDFNFFSLVYEWPNDLLTRLVFERGSADAAGKVADVMGADLVHEVISACVPPVFPPRSKNGWACIPRAAYSQQNVENGFHGNLSSASMYSRSHASVFGKSKDVKAQFYPLRLNVVKHLATISPVRAVLACVFGSSIFSAGYEYSDTVGLKKSSSDSSDADRIFYEFSLDQSYRFPTLNRWIQMQANLHRLSDSPITSRRVTETNLQNKEDKRITVKRLRESEGNESEEDDDVILGMPSTKSVFDIESKDDPTSSAIPQDVMNSRNLNPECINSLLFDWDNEVPYEEAVESLIEEGKLLDALALSDRCLRDGASDRLLQLLIERGEEGHLQSGQLYGYGAHQSFWSSSWQYCIRLRDKRLAANLALKYLHRWELDKAMDVLTMCSCHLDEKDPLRREVVHRKQALQRCNHILCVDGRFGSWQEVEAECKVDPEGLALRLAGKGAVSAALEVAESAGLSIELRRELQGRQLVKLLTADPIGGGGPAEASRFLCSLHEPDDALPVAMGAMQQLPNLQSKQLLVHFFLKRGMGTLSDSEAARLNRWALGLRVLGALPLPWQQRCSALHEHPHLILETLLMWKQLQSAKQLLNEFPSLRDEHLILTYAAKAIAVSTYPSSERRSSMANVASKPSPRTSASTRSNFSNSLSNLQKEARRAFSWTSRDSGNKIAPKEMNRKRKSSGLPPSQRVAWEAMAGIQEDRTPVFSVDGQERLASVAMAEGWVLTGDPVKDEGVRLSHRYESAPDIILLKALLSLCSDQSVAAKGALELCITQMKHVLSAQQIPLNASTEIVGRAYHATETFVQVLAHAKTELRKFSGRAELSTSMNKSRETDDGSSDTGSSSTGNQLTDELSELLAQADLWLSHAELLQSLLGSGVVASLDDVADKESAAQLRDRLIKDERYSMAVYTCKKCKIDAFPVWNAWGHALIRMEHYTQARVKFKQALQLHKGDPAPVIREIINTIEAGPPVDKAGVHSLYDHLAKSAPTILDDSLSADAYLNVLYMPSSFPRSERLRRPSEDSADPYKTFSSSTQEMAEDGPRSNLDNVRYMECVSYLQEYARVEILEFMFRHGHYKEACLLFFPPNAVPAPPQSSMHQQPTASSLPQRQDSILATDYGTIDDLCELCIGNGAMPVLEHVIAMRSIGSSTQETAVNQHTANALTRICNYCETHRNFNHLYRFQVLRKDHVAAGLCCIQLFLNSPHQEQALKHLEHAKMHFEDGLAARHKLKNIPKPGRGKSASEKLTEEELVKFSARVAIQMDVVRCFSDAEFPPWKHSLFGNPNDSETFRRRCEIAETLVERNFDLAFQIIYEFNLPAVHIYAGVAASLAERKKGNQLTEFLKNIRGTIEEDDWDQVLGAAINVFANRHRERPDKLIDMLSSSHRKVLACVVCGRLKSAFQIASRSGNVADVQYVAHQALKSGALPVLDMCKQWLAQYM